MKRVSYQALGYVVWKSARWYIRRRLGDTPRRIAVAGMVLTAVGVIVLAGWRTQAA